MYCLLIYIKYKVSFYTKLIVNVVRRGFHFQFNILIKYIQQ